MTIPGWLVGIKKTVATNRWVQGCLFVGSVLFFWEDLAGLIERMIEGVSVPTLPAVLSFVFGLLPWWGWVLILQSALTMAVLIVARSQAQVLRDHELRIMSAETDLLQKASAEGAKLTGQKIDDIEVSIASITRILDDR